MGSCTVDMIGEPEEVTCGVEALVIGLQVQKV